MTKPETLLDYGRRVARVHEYIASHLDQVLDLDQLAAVAFLSRWHFHRIYRETTGETVAETVRRLRLHRAAVDLVQADAPLTRIARRAGYGSLPAFGRAFAAAYGLPPGTYRLRGQLHPPLPDRMTRETFMHGALPHGYDVTIERFPGVALAAVSHEGDYMQITRAFKRVIAWADAKGLDGRSLRGIGIYYDDPESVPADEQRSEAGLVVPEGVTLDGEVRRVEIPAGRCASVIHKGPYAELERAYRFLYRDWLSRSGHLPADQPCFEEYLNDPSVLPPSEWLTRIYLPLAD
jgi:AraC family transcriptional regulator